MITLQSVGALPNPPKAWNQINWKKCYRIVNRLQLRIAKATKEKRWGRVKALQWLLTHSFSAKALAVRKVTENAGKRTPGIDGITWQAPTQRFQAIYSLKRRGYKARPVKRVKIPKRDGGFRPLGIPTMQDRAMQALYKMALEPVSETLADPKSYGFRPARSTADARESCFKALARRCAATWVLEGDIAACFDNISHAWLLKHVPMDKSMLRRWLKAGIMEHQQYHPSTAGTPQGGILSPLLANLALDGMSQILKADKALQGKKVNLIRYADDFVVTGESEDLLKEIVKPKITAFLQARGLRLSQTKTAITHIQDGFDFLGWNMRKYGNKLLIKPSPKACRAIHDKVKATTKAHRAATQVQVINALNPIIRGWCNYHRHAVASKSFSKLAYYLYWKLWRWGKRRHPNKGAQWVREKYFPKIQGERVFATYEVSKHSRLRCLANPAKVPIKRHIKVRDQANPYDKADRAYFAMRTTRKVLSKLSRPLWQVWQRQSGRCTTCGQMVTKESKWNVHHLIPKKEGGTDSPSNLVMLHPDCHRQLHSLAVAGLRKRA